MRTLTLLVLLFFGSVIKLYSQTSIVIEELRISNITRNNIKGIYSEDEEDGPFLFFIASLENESEGLLKIFPVEANLEAVFNYKDNAYQTKIDALVFQENDSLIIKVHDKFEFNGGCRLLLGTPMWTEKMNDYSKILLEILPTLRIRYKDSFSTIYSNQIRKVVIL